MRSYDDECPLVREQPCLRISDNDDCPLVSEQRCFRRSCNDDCRLVKHYKPNQTDCRMLHLIDIFTFTLHI